ncbi:vWA domain-containing protein [Methylocella sp.]|uniref:vWA domain-containing protein n=1 Tax=Methylocella sp. TaxID=1978226 RepID=UPI0037832664
MTDVLARPWALWLLPLALLPLFSGLTRRRAYPSLAGAPADPLSRLVSGAIRLAGAFAVAATILALAGPRSGGGSVTRVGEGAETALLIDRSASMNDTFAGAEPSGGEESKAQAARHVLQDYLRRRPHDRFGVIGFSTSPMPMLPMTGDVEAAAAAVAAIDRPGLAYTDIGRGLAAALSLLEGEARDARVLLLVSDGAAVIDPKVQDRLRMAIARSPVNLYWLFLRTANAPGLHDLPKAGADTPQAMPERHLDLFFKSLGVPYRAFEVENPGAVEAAVAAIGRLETRPVVYQERLPVRDETGRALAVALTCVLLLLGAKLAETDLARTARAAPGARTRRPETAA